MSLYHLILSSTFDERPKLVRFAEASRRTFFGAGRDYHQPVNTSNRYFLRRAAGCPSSPCELHLLERGAAEKPVGTGERLEDLEVVVALRDEELCRLAGCFDRG